MVCLEEHIQKKPEKRLERGKLGRTTTSMENTYLLNIEKRLAYHFTSFDEFAWVLSCLILTKRGR